MSFTKKQRIHKDGPTLYDKKQFDDRGNILPDAREYTSRNTPLPSGISVSALFAFFCRTFLGIKLAQAWTLIQPQNATVTVTESNEAIGRAPSNSAHKRLVSPLIIVDATLALAAVSLSPAVAATNATRRSFRPMKRF